MGDVLAASNLTVNLIGGGLVLLGLALLVATLAFWRSAVEDPEVLAPLEVMADRRFARASHERRVDMLNSVRPEGEEPIFAVEAPPVLSREPISVPNDSAHRRESDDGHDVDVVVPDVIDPLLHFQNKNNRD